MVRETGALSDARRVAQAVLTNQLARLAPRLYVRLTGQTGRGSEAESAAHIAAYFRQCFEDYFRILQVAPDQVEHYLAGKRVLEYGPGDVPGVALLMVAHGAEQVVCVDRFPLVSLSAKNVEVLEQLVNGLQGRARTRALSCFATPGEPASGLGSERIDYRIRSNGLSGLAQAVDLIISRAVLEHVNDLSATFADMQRALRPGGVAVHQVDLKSHGLHQREILDFLTWSPRLWQWMYSGKGVPNRWRVDRYRQAVAENGLQTLLLEPTLCADPQEVAAVRPYLAAPFRALSDADLACLGFWLVCQKAARP